MRRKNFPMSQKLALLLGDMGITVLVYLFVTTVVLARGSLIIKETLKNSFVARLSSEILQ